MTTYRVTFTAESAEQTFTSRAVLTQEFVGHSADGGEIWVFTTDSENAVKSYKVRDEQQAAFFRITPLWDGVPQPEEAAVIKVRSDEEIEMYRTGWTVDGAGNPVRIAVMSDEVSEDEYSEA